MRRDRKEEVKQGRVGVGGKVSYEPSLTQSYRAELESSQLLIHFALEEAGLRRRPHLCI